MKLKDLLLENPDTLTLNGHDYRYSTNANVCTFSIFEDLDLDQMTYLGYNAKLKKLLCNNPTLLEKCNGLVNKGYVGFPRDNAGGHTKIDDLLSSAYGDLGSHNMNYKNYRIFEVQGTVVMTTWASPQEMVEYKNLLFKVIIESGYDPKTVLYEKNESDETKYSYDELMNGFQPLTGGNQLSQTDADKQLDKEIKEKNSEYSDKMSQFHTQGPIIGRAGIERLKTEISLLKAEIKVMTTSRKSNSSDLKLKMTILKVIRNQPRTEQQLYKMLEDELGTTVNQIKEMYKHINVDRLVKEMVSEVISYKKTL